MVYTVNKENSLLLGMRLGSIVTLLLLVYSLQAQLYFSPLTVKDGLAQSSVNFVIADKLGYYWIGTQYGLSRFNGQEFENFYSSSHPGISDNFFLSAVSDTAGNLWFATRNGLCRYLLKEKKFQTIVLPQPTSSYKGYNPIWNLTKSPAGDLYFIAASICYFISAQECTSTQPHIKPIFKSGTSYRYLASSGTQLLLLQNDSVVVYGWQGQTLGKRMSYAYRPFGSTAPLVVRTLNHNFYVASEKQLYRIGDSALHEIELPFVTADISDLLQYKQNILIASYQGLFKTDLQFNLQEQYAHAKENPFSISENKLLSISTTSDGCVWIGTANSGINLHKPVFDCFKVLSKLEGQRYLSFCVKQINATTVLVGTENGYDCFVYQKGRWKYNSTKFTNHKVSCILNYRDINFLGTTRGLYYESKATCKRIEAVPESAQIFDLQLQEKSNHLLVSTTAGLFVINLTTLKADRIIDRNSKTPNSKNLIGTNYVFSSTVHNNSNILVNTTTGTYEIDSSYNKSHSIFEHYPYKSLNEIMIVKSLTLDGDLFCGSLGNGLYRINNGVISTINSQQGLSNNVIASMEKDTEGDLWLSTNNGITCYTGAGRMFPYTDELPLSSVEFITNASASFQNSLWFCSNSGVIGFQAKELLANSAASQLHLQPELVSKNYTDTLQADSVLEFSTADKNINFRFCAPGINNFSKTLIAFRLQGFDTTWRVVGNNKNISFSNLQSGTYVLEVEAKIQGTEITANRRYILRVIPPFFQRTWFIITLSLVSIVFTVLLVYYFSRLRLKRKLLLLQAEQKLYEEKQRISEELHDNIGSQISTIISGLDKMQLKGQVPQAENLSDFARGTLHELRETIWALHLNKVSVTEIRTKIENHVFELRNNFEEIIFETSFIISNNASFEPEKALSIFRIFQEAVSNALKHSAATKLSIQLCSNEIDFSIVVADNGKGFDTGLRKNGHYGLDNMAARASKHGITFEIQSELNKGAQITLLLKYND